MGFSIVIPARHGSSRLPGKPLHIIGSKTLIQHVYECAQKSDAAEIIIATDDERIEVEALSFSANVIMTSADHGTGTDRLAEVIAKKEYSDDHVIVNLQGDEPLMPASVINQVAENLQNNIAASSATVCTRINTVDELFDPNVVKVVTDKNGFALYFSRASIPWDRDHFPNHSVLPENAEHYRHIGLYAYRAGFLKQFVQWPVCHHEKVESLEQLRSLWNGEKIHVDVAKEIPGPGIDTPEDLRNVRKMFED
ncbi:MAG: 3-deoxy-manno-octulosonate cytidylyltransferase [Gammaproteobacteria bacterium]|nr:3-deoxy-manno-octulosonate cytidylyltransferase [Gammaproteobacteria bacterium]